jgi:protein-arginine kinase activator protein McsA
VIRNESKQRRAKIAKLLESTILAERTAAHCYRSFEENLVPNYTDEKTGRKFY